MTAAIYSLAAALIAALTTRAWLLGRDERPRQAFLRLGWSLATAYMSFAISFLPGLDMFRALWTLGLVLSPVYMWQVVDAFFPTQQTGAWRGALLEFSAWFVGVGAAILHATFFAGASRASLPEMFTGGVAALLFLGLLHRLRIARLDARLRVTRTRIALLSGLTALGGILTVVEWFVRTTSPMPDVDSLPFFDRGLALQGALPPASSLVATAVVYMLYHALLAHRLVALQELVARMATVAASAAVLVAVHTLTLRWVELARFPLQSGFLLFLVSAVFLSVWGSAREPMTRWATRWLNPPGQALEEAVVAVADDLSRHVTAEQLALAIVGGLHASGRFDGVGVWLFAADLGAYRRRASEGLERSLVALAPDRLPTSLDDPARGWLGVRTAGDRAPRAPGLLEALRADLVFPLRGDTTLLGWIAVREAAATDGLSPEERVRVRDLARRAARAFANVESFRRQGEERRLAALGAMSAGLAHEIRNPLAGVKGAAQVLQDEPLDGVGREMLDVVLQETDRLERVVSEFLEFARPNRPDPGAVDLGAIARRVARLVDAGLPDDAPTVALELAPDVSARADADQISQVLLNLVRNALDAVGDDGTVTIRTEAVGARVRVMVEDDGPGIPPDVLDHLYTPFFTTKSFGTGLGLPICKRIVDVHGGTLAVRTAPGEGTTFSVWLPAPTLTDDAVSIDTTDDAEDDDLDDDDSYSSANASSSSDGGSGPAPGTNLELS